MAAVLPRYPIFIPSKGRYETCFTARCLAAGGVPFHLVVEPQEAEAYADRWGAERIIILPFRDRGSVVPARNFIWEQALQTGAERHWILDDNMKYFSRRYKGKRLYVEPGIALRVCEDFTDRYTNIAIAGLNYTMFAPDGPRIKPFYLNVHVYSCMLLRNDLPLRWRGQYNEDTDLCLQALSAGWCTVLLNTFLVRKEQTMTVRGGNTQELYQDDGRLRMARSLERMWPGVVTTKRRFQRPQHVVKDDWKFFDTPLQLKPEVDLARLPAVNEYGMTLQQVTPEVKSQRIKGLLDAWRQSHTDHSDSETSPSQDVLP